MRKTVILDDLTVTLPDHVLYQQLSDEEVVLLDLQKGEYYGLNAVGSRFWQLVPVFQGRVDAITRMILEEFDVSEDVLVPDLEQFLRTMESRGLLVVHRGRHGG